MLSKMTVIITLLTFVQLSAAESYDLKKDPVLQHFVGVESLRVALEETTAEAYQQLRRNVEAGPKTPGLLLPGRVQYLKRLLDQMLPIIEGSIPKLIPLLDVAAVHPPYQFRMVELKGEKEKPVIFASQLFLTQYANDPAFMQGFLIQHFQKYRLEYLKEKDEDDYDYSIPSASATSSYVHAGVYYALVPASQRTSNPKAVKMVEALKHAPEPGEEPSQRWLEVLSSMSGVDQGYSDEIRGALLAVSKANPDERWAAFESEILDEVQDMYIEMLETFDLSVTQYRDANNEAQTKSLQQEVQEKLIDFVGSGDRVNQLKAFRLKLRALAFHAKDVTTISYTCLQRQHGAVVITESQKAQYRTLSTQFNSLLDVLNILNRNKTFTAVADLEPNIDHLKLTEKGRRYIEALSKKVRDKLQVQPPEKKKPVRPRRPFGPQAPTYLTSVN